MLPNLIIGDIKTNIPIIQGGMGVRISTAPLVSAVCNEGCLGVIASVGLCETASNINEYTKDSSKALEIEIKRTREKTSKPFGVNIMCVLTNYNSLVETCVKNNVDIIISGAGIPLHLPSLVTGTNIKLVPIVSSVRAATLILKVWKNKYNKVPDAFIVEGPLAGGHLGFNLRELKDTDNYSLERIVSEIVNFTRIFNIPIIAAGGIFDGKDIVKFLKLGASGVQIATRFVCTEECEASIEFKNEFIRATKEDMIIIKSPVGLLGRVIRNNFVDRITKGEKIDFSCSYKCLQTCDPKNSAYCIAQALCNAYKGNLSEGFAMGGSNSYRLDKIITVKQLIEELVKEAQGDTISEVST